MKLNDKIKTGEIKLTEKEKICLQAIRNQGSFFEESGGNEEVANYGQAFFGWEINKEDVGFNPAGPIASLVKKGVIDARQDPDDLTGYCINYELDFAEDDEYKIIFAE